MAVAALAFAPLPGLRAGQSAIAPPPAAPAPAEMAPPAPPEPPAPPAPPVIRPLIVRPAQEPERPLGPDVGVATDDLSEEIVIIARKLRMVNVHLMRKANGSPANCTVLKSSGDTEVDQLTCEAAVSCASQFTRRETPPEVLTQCTREEQARLVGELAERRMQEELKN